MKIDTSHNVTVTSSLDVPAVEMSLDQDGLVHLMSVLTNLYSDKHLAVLREYSTNALDSHVAAGNPAPIEVTLPTVLNPTLVVTDHGLGLSRREIVEVYARYGASTKRDTDTQVGSFGLGAKSAFTIGGQFVVTATKDGLRTSAVFALDERGVGSVSILAEHETTDPNGVTVSVAVDEPHRMQEAAAKFFRAWRPGTVLVNGRAPESYFTSDDALWLGDDVLFTKTGSITVVMGSVAYPLPHSAVSSVRARAEGTWRSWGDHPGLAVFVPIGAVDITPSREGVRDTERTIAAVAARLSDLPQRFGRALSAVLDAAPDTVSGVLAARPILAAAEWVGVPVKAQMPADVTEAGGTAYGLTRRGGLYSDKLDTISYATLPQLTVLVGIPERRSAKPVAKQWLQDNPRRTLVVFGDGQATSGSAGWVTWGGTSPVQVVNFADVTVPRKPRTSAPRGAATYSVRSAHEGRYGYADMTAAELNAATAPLAYFDGGRTADYRELAGALSGYLVVEVTAKQSTEVFRRRVPGAVPAWQVVSEWTKARLAELGDLDALADAEDRADVLDQITAMLGERRTAQITHPSYLAAVSRANAYTRLSPADRELFSQHRGYRRHRDADEVMPELVRDLPLLMHVVDMRRSAPPAALDHLVTAINAAPVPAPAES